VSASLFRPRPRTIVLLDAIAVLWIVVWIVVGVLLAREVRELTELSATLEQAGGAIEQTGQGLRQVADVPFIGGQIRAFGERVEETGSRTRLDAAETRESIEALSRALGAVVALMPSALLLALYLPARVLWHRESSAVRRALRRDPSSPALQEFLARRAAATLPYHELRRVSENPWADLGEGRYDRLAEAELGRLGVRRPPSRA
jgi:hypothetical protein